LCGHAVECGIELGALGIDTLVGLLEAQRDAATLEIDVDDLDEDFLTGLDNLLSELNVLTRKLGDVHETLDAVCNANERAERNELGDCARSNLADRVSASEQLPRIFLSSLQRQRYAL